MLKVDNNRITITKGDTLSLEIELTEADGSAYQYVEGDMLRFAISEAYEGDINYHLIYEDSFAADHMNFVMSANETENLRYKTYNYDIELTRSDGTVDTVISSQLVVTGEVE